MKRRFLTGENRENRERQNRDGQNQDGTADQQRRVRHELHEFPLISQEGNEGNEEDWDFR